MNKDEYIMNKVSP